MPKKMLIMGATGFIGRNMAQFFRNSYHVECHRFTSEIPEELDDLIWYQCDLRDPKWVDWILDRAEPDIVLQFAATTTGSKDVCLKPAVHVTDNAVMNSYIFRRASELNIEHVVYPSCTTMYSSDIKAWHEDDFIKFVPRQYFGVAHTKMYLERMAEFYSSISDTDFTVMRHSNVYGPHDKYDLERSHVFGATVTKVLTCPKDGQITMWGNGTEHRDLLYIDDLISFVEVTLEESVGYMLFNVGTECTISILDLVDKIKKVAGREDIEILWDHSKPTIPVSFYINCSRANKLGWQPWYQLNTGIEKTIKWYREEFKDELQGL